MRWLYITVIGILLALIVGGMIYMGNKQEVILDRERLDSIQVKDSFETKGTGVNQITKNYTSKDERVVIKDFQGNVVLNISLITPKKNVIPLGGENTLVAEISLDGFRNVTIPLSSAIEFYDIRDGNRPISKNIRWAYGIDYNFTGCFDSGNGTICPNITRTNWTGFNLISEIPSSKIKIGIFADTYLHENTEWIMTAGGFRIPEWAEWNISTATWDGVNSNLSILNSDNTPRDVFFKDDGMKLYIIGSTNDTIYSYLLSTAWQINTSTWEGAVSGFNVSTQSNIPTDFFFKPDGTKMYVIAQDPESKVFSYTLSTPWMVNTSTWDGVNSNFSTAVQVTNDQGFFFKPDGTKMYVVGGGRPAYSYTLSTPWMVNTSTWDGVGSNLSGGTAQNSQDLVFSPDGTKLRVISGFDSMVISHTLSTAWQINTSTWDGSSTNLSVALQDTSLTGLFFKPDGTKMYITGSQNDRVYSYSMADTTSPQWSSRSVNVTSPQILDSVLFSAQWTDDTALSSYIFEWNGTGALCNTVANDTAVTFIGTTNWSNVSKQIPVTCVLGDLPNIAWRVYANDSSNNKNNTPYTFSFVAGASNCWAYDSGTKMLSIPTDCVYVVPSGEVRGI